MFPPMSMATTSKGHSLDGFLLAPHWVVGPSQATGVRAKKIKSFGYNPAVIPGERHGISGLPEIRV